MIREKKLNLLNYNSYKINSICSIGLFPESEEDLVSIFNEFSEVSLLGGGNNIILSKEYYEQPFLIISEKFSKITLDGQIIEADAGADMAKLSLFALRNELTGLEIFYDIPSSVGGAIYMNAGASDFEIKNIIQKVRYYDIKKKSFNEKSTEELKFSYRKSEFYANKNLIITKAWFKLEKGKYLDILSKMKKFRDNRWRKQPREYPSGGSVFKRPDGKYVGPMIEKLGLKGYRINDAQVSEKHAGFIINIGRAKGSDIISLIQYIQKEVMANYGVNLEIEQIIV